MADKYGNWTVKELKRELKNRNAKVTGKKEDLIERLVAYDRNRNFDMVFPVEESSLRVSVVNTSNVQWPLDNTFISLQATSTVPPIDIVHINNYFLKACQSGEGMSMYASVHRKGYNMMQNNFLMAVMQSQNQHYAFYRAQVNSEMTKALTYFVKLVLMLDGSIEEASCECIAGMGTRAVCKHIAVLSYALLYFREQGKLCIRNTCTEKKQVWHLPKKSKLEISPKKAENLNYNILEYNVCKKQQSNHNFDPRPDCFKNMPSFNSNARNLVLNYTNRQKRSFCFNGSFSQFATVEGINNDHEYLDRPPIYQMIYNRIQVSNKDAESIEKATKCQSKSAVWFRERSVRLTASNIGTIVHMTDKKNVHSFLETIINPKPIRSKATDWGKLNEKNAINAYEEATTNTVIPCGLFISLDHPYLAASPDGLVRELTVLEVKCPYSIKDFVITSETLPYLEKKKDELSLKKSSNYYFQVQTQMYITKRKYCDFVIWTLKDYKCISVEIDYDVINNEIIPKTKLSYDTYMVPALAKKYYIE